MKVLFDHVGYAPDAPKVLLVEAPADTVWDAVTVVRLPAGDRAVAREPVLVGAVDGWS